jgi:hypothetical protein
VLTAAALGIMAGLHLDLYSSYGYKSIHTIGTLFLINGIAGSVLCLAVLAIPRRLLGLTALASAGLLAGTLAGLIVSVNHPLFGFQDSMHAPHAWTVLIDEIVGTVIATAVALFAFRGVGLRASLALRQRA